MLARIARTAAFALLLAGCLSFGPGGCKPAAAPATTVKLVRYDVQGMHCDGCVNAITAKVLKVNGVASCEVSLEEHRATVGLSDPKQSGEVEAAITKLGYTIGPADDAAKPAATGG